MGLQLLAWVEEKIFSRNYYFFLRKQTLLVFKNCRLSCSCSSKVSDICGLCRVIKRKMMFNNDQYTEMVLFYGECHWNKREAARQYALKFPNKNHPSVSTVLRIVNCLRETSSVQDHITDSKCTYLWRMS